MRGMGWGWWVELGEREWIRVAFVGWIFVNCYGNGLDSVDTNAGQPGSLHYMWYMSDWGRN